MAGGRTEVRLKDGRRVDAQDFLLPVMAFQPLHRQAADHNISETALNAIKSVLIQFNAFPNEKTFLSLALYYLAFSAEQGLLNIGGSGSFVKDGIRDLELNGFAYSARNLSFSTPENERGSLNGSTRELFLRLDLMAQSIDNSSLTPDQQQMLSYCCGFIDRLKGEGGTFRNEHIASVADALSEENYNGFKQLLENIKEGMERSAVLGEAELKSRIKQLLDTAGTVEDTAETVNNLFHAWFSWHSQENLTGLPWQLLINIFKDKPEYRAQLVHLMRMFCEAHKSPEVDWILSNIHQALHGTIMNFSFLLPFHASTSLLTEVLPLSSIYLPAPDGCAINLIYNDTEKKWQVKIKLVLDRLNEISNQSLKYFNQETQSVERTGLEEIQSELNAAPLISCELLLDIVNVEGNQFSLLPSTVPGTIQCVLHPEIKMENMNRVAEEGFQDRIVRGELNWIGNSASDVVFRLYEGREYAIFPHTMPNANLLDLTANLFAKRAESRVLHGGVGSSFYRDFAKGGAYSVNGVLVNNASYPYNADLLLNLCILMRFRAVGVGSQLIELQRVIEVASKTWLSESQKESVFWQAFLKNYGVVSKSNCMAMIEHGQAAFFGPGCFDLLEDKNSLASSLYVYWNAVKSADHEKSVAELGNIKNIVLSVKNDLIEGLIHRLRELNLDMTALAPRLRADSADIVDIMDDVLLANDTLKVQLQPLQDPFHKLQPFLSANDTDAALKLQKMLVLGTLAVEQEKLLATFSETEKFLLDQAGQRMVIDLKNMALATLAPVGRSPVNFEQALNSAEHRLNLYQGETDWFVRLHLRAGTTKKPLFEATMCFKVVQIQDREFTLEAIPEDCKMTFDQKYLREKPEVAEVVNRVRSSQRPVPEEEWQMVPLQDASDAPAHPPASTHARPSQAGFFTRLFKRRATSSTPSEDDLRKQLEEQRQQQADSKPGLREESPVTVIATTGSPPESRESEGNSSDQTRPGGPS